MSVAVTEEDDEEKSLDEIISEYENGSPE